MTTPTIRAALDTFQQAANRGTAVYLSPELVQELRAALKAELEGEGPSEADLYDLAEMFNGDPVPAMRRALELWSNPPASEAPAEALAARPLLERVAQLGDVIGRQTVAQVQQLANQAAVWLRSNPPGQPVAIEPRGCPTPGACSCVEPTPPAPEPGPTFQDAIKLAEGCHDYSGGHSGAEGEAWHGAIGMVVDVLKRAAIGPWDSQLKAVFGVGAEAQAGEVAVPVAVSERPWEREGWCDAEGRCWLGSPGNRLNDHGWVYRKPCELLHQMFSLPHDAIPLPAPQAGEVEA